VFLSASRRTDIPAFFSEWFFNRLKEGFLYVRNPMNFYQVSKINLSKEIIDCIVFWTKNPKEMLNRIDELDKTGYRYYFHYTINPYGKEIEKNVPELKNNIEVFKELSRRIGSKRVIWRYDPIILSEKFDIEYHMKKFNEISYELSSFTERCVISFLDFYPKKIKIFHDKGFKEIGKDEMKIIADNFSRINNKYGFEIFTCCEEIDLDNYGIKHGKCIDDHLFSEVFGIIVSAKKDSTQRRECGCINSIDIGAYNTCKHGCIYCYANKDLNLINNNINNHSKFSPFLFGEKGEKDIIAERKVESFICNENIQMRLM